MTGIKKVSNLIFAPAEDNEDNNESQEDLTSWFDKGFIRKAGEWFSQHSRNWMKSQ